ncbi:hypothetical protein A3844_00530 [Paenibacillus helianthi]|uniref:SLH domain-containing protein n=1 Tax=Paenibacillus helianthi TaxID=1349432 RepID=A0ABX3EY08_9BACL|nr:S-layer homology domain-containing protein [Paenibacillus helianthi]OKP91648.1 hypothetical protein A3844_00530 [Paenibacillus helianthi]
MLFSNKWIKLLCCTLLLVPLQPGAKPANASGGSWGDHADTSWYSSDYSTYIIDSAAKLAGVAKLVNDGITDFGSTTLQIAATGPLSLAEYNWMPIGNAEHPFRGTLVGQAGLSPELTGMTVTDSVYGGLIGRMSGATVGRFSLTGSIDTIVSGDASVGGIAGYMDEDSTILDVNSDVSVQVRGTVTGNVYAGGIVGSGSGLLSAVANHGRISLIGANWGMAGGIAGSTNSVLTLKKSDNTGPVSVSGSVYMADAGGIIGLVSAPLFMAEEDTFMKNSGQITLADVGSGSAGGIMGRVTADSSVTISLQTSNTGEIRVDSGAAAGAGGTGIAAGGLVGAYENTGGLNVSIPFVQTAPAIVNKAGGRAYTGSIVGRVAGDFTWGQSVVNSSSLAAGGSSEVYTGGIAGKVEGTASFVASAWNQATIQVAASGTGVYTGGLVGFAGDQLLFHSTGAEAYGNSGSIAVTGTASDVNTGGIISNRNYGKAAANVLSKGDIEVTGGERLYSGGYVGKMTNGESGITNESYNGHISVSSIASGTDNQVYTGGIVGYYGLGGVITDPVFTGRIKVAGGAGVHTGGVAGYMTGGGTIAGAVIGGTAGSPAVIHSSGNAGGVAGYANGVIRSSTVKNTEITASGSGGSAGGIAGTASGQIADVAVGEADADGSYTVKITTAAADSAAGGVAGRDAGTLVLGTARVNRITLSAEELAARSSLGGLAGKLSLGTTVSVAGKTFNVRSIKMSSAAAGSALGGVIGDNSLDLNADILQNVSDISIDAQGDHSDLGGIAGRNSGQLTKLTVMDVSIKSAGAASQLGGIAGWSTGVIISPVVIPGDGELQLAIEGSDSTVGGVAGSLSGGAAVSGNGADRNVTGLSITAAASASKARIGGIAGDSKSSAIRNMIVESPVLNAAGADSMIGGLVGRITGADIEQSVVRGILPDYAILNVSGSGVQAGGVAGRAEDAVLTGGGASAPAAETLLLTGTESAAGLYAGGIVGYNTDSAIKQVSGSTIKLSLKGTGTIAGGITGYNRGVAGYGLPAASRVMEDNVMNAMTLVLSASAASSTAGGLIGLNDARSDEDSGKPASSSISSIQRSKMTGSLTVHGPSSVTGGLVGENRSVVAKNSISNLLPVVSDGGNGVVGGLVGRNTGTIYFMSSNAVLSAGGKSTVIGGLAGVNTGRVGSSYNETDLKSSLSGTADNYALLGGLIGRNSGSIDKSFTMSKVTASGAYTYVGGLIGEHSGSVINSYTGKDVSASGKGSYSGGLIGRMTEGTVASSYSAGRITGDKGAYAGGFAGYYASTNKKLIDDTYYVKDESLSINSGVLDFGGGTYNELNNYARLSPVLSSTLADSKAFAALSGWTFGSSPWRYGSAGAKYTYPELNLSADDSDAGSNPPTLNLDWYTQNPQTLRFTIKTEDELAGLAAIVNGTAAEVEPFNFIGRTVDVAGPISIRASSWTPIGKDNSHSFEGTFNGNHHLIGDFRVIEGEYAGLFGVIGSSAVVRQVSVAPLSLTGSSYAGALAGLNLGKVEQVEGSLSGGAKVAGGTAAGGLIGQNNGEITGLAMTLGEGSKVSSTDDGASVGGLIGNSRSGLNQGSLSSRAGRIEATGRNAAAGGAAGRVDGELTAISVTLQDGGAIVAESQDSVAGGVAGVAESGTSDGLTVSLTGGGVQALAPGSIAGGIFGHSAAGQVIRHAKVQGDHSPGAAVSASVAAGGIAGDKAGAGSNTFDIESVQVRDITVVSAGEGGIVGGIAGKLADAALKDNVFSGALRATGNSAIAGGIVGQAKDSILYKLESSPQITVNASSGVVAAGGIAGILESSKRDTPLDFGLLVSLYPGVYEAELPAGLISINTSGQAAELYAGGIAGKLDSVSLYNSSSSVSLDLSGGKTATAGGAVGYAKDTRMAGIDSTSPIQAGSSTNYNVGGLAGKVSGGSIAYSKAQAADNMPIVVGDSIAAGRTEAYAHIGGFVGQADGADILSSSATQGILMNSTYPYSTVYAGGFAGLLGEDKSGVISVASATGEITVRGAAGVYAGGFAGTVNQYRIEQAYASGNVSSTAFDARGGGFAGVINHGSTIEDAYAAQVQVSVAGSNGATRSYAGGFAGYNDGSLSRVYEGVSEVSAVAGGSNSYMGAFIGYNFRNGLIEDSYYEGSLAPIKHDTSSGVQNGNLQLLSLDGYSQPEGWNFSGINPVWGFSDAKQSYAPILVGLSNWRFTPDLNVITGASKNQTSYSAGTAEELAALSLLYDDGASVYALYDPAAAAPLSIKSITLTGDISLSGKLWLPVADFRGVLDGKLHTISGLNNHSGDFNHYSLIADNFGVIANVKLQDAVVSVGPYTGVVAAVNHPDGMIKNVTVSGGRVSGTSAGGVTGDNQGMLSGIITENLTVAGEEYAGGAAGLNTGQLEGISVKGLTISSPAVAGGITGLNEGSIEASYSRATIKAFGQNGSSTAGGIAGQNGDVGRIHGSFSFSDIVVSAKDSSAGGIAGASRGTIADSYNTGTVESKGQATARAGGIAGEAAAGMISTAVNGGQIASSINGKLVKGGTFAGGIAGQAAKTVVLSHNFYDAQMLQYPVAYYTAEGSKTSGVVGQAEGISTVRLTGGMQPDGLEPSIWKTVQGFYPQLASFSGGVDSDLSTVAVVLKEGDTAYKVRGKYTTTPDATIHWTAQDESGSGPIYLTASKSGISRLIVVNKTPLAYGETAVAPTSSTALQFKDKTEVILTTAEAEGRVHYTMDGSAPSEFSPVYAKPIPLSASAVVKAITVVEGKNDSALLIAEFKKITDVDNGSGNGDGGGGNSGNGGGSSGGGTGGASSGSGSSSTLPVDSGNGFDILVNGKAASVAEAKSTTANGRTTTTITVDEAALIKLLQGAAGPADVSIIFSGKTDVNRAELSVKLVKLMAEHQAVIRLDTGTVAFRIPTALLAVSAADQEVVSLEFSAPDEQETKRLEQAAAAGSYTFLAKPINFRAMYGRGDQMKEIGMFDAFVERTMALPKTAAASNAIGVSIASDGSVSPQPIRITEGDQSLTAVIKSLSASGLYAVISAKAETSFRDVQSHWAREAITNLTRRLIVGGTGSGSFEPERSITRAEFSAILVKALGLGGYAAADSSTFSDVNAGAWYASYVKTAAEYGLVSGYPDGSFGAQEPISRQQMMTVLSRAMKLTGLQTEVSQARKEELLKPFADAGSVAGYAKSGFAAGIVAGLVSGRSSTKLAPSDLTTRAEAVTVIEKLLKLAGLI